MCIYIYIYLISIHTQQCYRSGWQTSTGDTSQLASATHSPTTLPTLSILPVSADVTATAHPIPAVPRCPSPCWDQPCCHIASWPPAAIPPWPPWARSRAPFCHPPHGRPPAAHSQEVTAEVEGRLFMLFFLYKSGRGWTIPDRTSCVCCVLITGRCEENKHGRRGPRGEEGLWGGTPTPCLPAPRGGGTAQRGGPGGRRGGADHRLGPHPQHSHGSKMAAPALQPGNPQCSSAVPRHNHSQRGPPGIPAASGHPRLMPNVAGPAAIFPTRGRPSWCAAPARFFVDGLKSISNQAVLGWFIPARCDPCVRDENGAAPLEPLNSLESKNGPCGGRCKKNLAVLEQSVLRFPLIHMCMVLHEHSRNSELPHLPCSVDTAHIALHPQPRQSGHAPAQAQQRRMTPTLIQQNTTPGKSHRACKIFLCLFI